MILDLIALEAAYLAAHMSYLRGLDWFFAFDLYLQVNIMVLIINVCYVLLRTTYKNILKRSVFRELESVLLQNFFVWVIPMIYLYLTKQSWLFSRGVFSMTIIYSVVFMLALRIGWKSVIRSRVLKGVNQSYILMITTEAFAARMLQQFSSRMYNGFNLCGLAIMDRDMAGERIERTPVVCGKDDLLEFVRTEVVDEVMINLSRVNSEELDELIWTLLQMGIVVHIGLDYVDDQLPNRNIERIGGYTFLTTSINSTGSVPLALKRLTDIFAGLAGCLITGLLFLVLAPAIYKESPGPIFYKQVRMGKNGRRFEMYKFRSMYLDADKRKAELMAQNKMQGNMFKIDNDPRIIGSEKGPGKGIGNFIREHSLDEFPQFYNILKGDMSLVGTRPPTEDEFEKYDLHHKVRLSMKPGLTGMWQVSGRSEITDFEEIVRLDAEYIENWNLRLDIRIIFKTFLVVLKKQGAE